MTARFVILVVASVSLAACATATTTDDLTSVRRGASPTKGEIGPHRVMVRGPVVPDAAPAQRSTVVHRQQGVHQTFAAARTPAVATQKPATSSSGVHGVREVPNPLHQETTAASAAPSAPIASLPTEPVQPASITDQPVLAAPPPVTQSTVGEVPIQEAPAQSEPSGTIAPALLGLSNITPDSIEQMFGGMPFWLISVIAAALVATFGLALRRAPDKDEGYEEPQHAAHHDHDEDYREPYAA